MSWLLRFVAWATLLALPSFWLGDAYHRLLASVSMRLLAIPVDAGGVAAPDIPASHALGVYAALCLASTRAPLARRLTAVALGLAAMIALEIATGTLALRWALAEALTGTPPSPALERVRDHLTALPAWIGAPALWLMLLGRWELPGAARAGKVSGRDPGVRASPRAG